MPKIDGTDIRFTKNIYPDNNAYHWYISYHYEGIRLPHVYFESSMAIANYFNISHMSKLTRDIVVLQDHLHP